jgi:hypothetical protein
METHAVGRSASQLAHSSPLVTCRTRRCEFHDASSCERWRPSSVARTGSRATSARRRWCGTGNLGDADTAMASPADRQQPAPCGYDGTGHRRARLDAHALRPAVERDAGRVRVDALDANFVLARVVEDVGERVASFPRRVERASMVPVGEHTSGAAPTSVQSTRDAHREALHAARERAGVLSFDERVHVVRLDREVHEAHATAIVADPKRVEQQRPLRRPAQARQTTHELHRDEHRDMTRQPGASAMRNERLLALRLPPRADARSAAPRERELARARWMSSRRSRSSHGNLDLEDAACARR